MSRNPSALASLTANYTDSENEDDQNSDEDGHQTEDSNESQVQFTIPFQNWNRIINHKVIHYFRRWSFCRGQRHQ